ncbi:MAG TPA: hypothetical protein VM781_02015, partial [Candidatus Bathyarchaeia archaeon]|nr:hypothetical protein [Candidatus Bathyarchaeia archaeon]
SQARKLPPSSFNLLISSSFLFLLELFQLAIEVRQRCFELLSVVGVGRGFQIVEDMFAREFNVRAFAVFFQLVLSFPGFTWCRHVLPAGYLGFDVFGFPAASHT